MISFHEALKIIQSSISSLDVISLPIEQSLQYVLAEDIIASENIPPFDNSSMDGFAVRAEDVSNLPTILNVIEEVPAGSVSQKTLQQNEAMQIMTGAKIPRGSDAVIQQEWVECIDSTRIKILRSVSFGNNIRKAGNDISENSLVLERGVVIRPQEIGVLASLGKSNIPVYRKPNVAILTTGNEVVNIDENLEGGKIRNSNYYSIQALVQENNCSAMNLGIAHDEREELRKKISEGLQYDMLITSGGVSVGKYDLVLETMKELGVEIKFWKVNIKPGMPIVFGKKNNTTVFGLPGNPVSTMVTFLQFVKPALEIMKGKNSSMHSKLLLRATLEHEIVKNDGKRHFVRGIVENRNGSLVVRSTGTQISNALTSMMKANCLIVLPEEKEVFLSGENVVIEII